MRYVRLRISLDYIEIVVPISTVQIAEFRNVVRKGPRTGRAIFGPSRPAALCRGRQRLVGNRSWSADTVQSRRRIARHASTAASAAAIVVMHVTPLATAVERIRL